MCVTFAILQGETTQLQDRVDELVREDLKFWWSPNITWNVEMIVVLMKDCLGILGFLGKVACRKSKKETLVLESGDWTILMIILCFVLDFQGN